MRDEGSERENIKIRNFKELMQKWKRATNAAEEKKRERRNEAANDIYSMNGNRPIFRLFIAFFS